MRSSEEVMMRCKLILDRNDVVSLVDKSNSPTAAYDMIMDATGSDEIAKAARWLGVLRRDYPELYSGLIRNLSQAQKGTAKKGGSNEEIVRS